MKLPVMPPVAPMLAKSVKDVPEGDYLYEPKWDGFRCIVFRDCDEVELGSRNERPLTRYFPEVVEAVKAALPERCVVDGEVVVATDDHLDFDALLQRIHPAKSRVDLLARETPASFVAFDLLALGDDDLTARPMAQRRALLEQHVSPTDRVHVTQATDDVALARQWFAEFEGAGLDGVVAKAKDIAYQPDVRAMLKIKHERTADCVVAGYRLHKSGPVVGSLLLGLYNEDGALQHVGVSASFPMKRRAELIEELSPLRLDDVSGHPWASWAEAAAHEQDRLPGAQSRWNAKKDLSWVPLAPELVCEVGYDHMEGTRFRHTAQFKRWRPDRTPESCTYAQLERPVTYDLSSVLGGAAGGAAGQAS
ncbi:MAG: ATP-dependent DNA ligase [Motilibacteraceae bacterium]